MSGFSADWLSLREPADHRARDAALAGRLAAYLGDRDSVRLIDLGCGTGSNLRALASRLPMPQDWLLIDYDARLLEAAGRQIEAWRTASGVNGLTVGFEQADLESRIEDVLDKPCDAVTASALFDLVSESWLDRFAAALAARRCAFYTVLIYDGVMRWSPAHPADGAIAEAFNAHQRSDKGFGTAAGPDAGPYLAARLQNEGYQVFTATSPWRLTADDMPLILATAQGIADAARETGQVAQALIDSWLAARSQLQNAEVGHIDILALPQI
ncbi:MAG: class I SAM-dependent methyltransferase [Rhodomicrobium sp.]|nr:class I SAM-dependent methyltransferase [Rhodomicrobium sp.]